MSSKDQHTHKIKHVLQSVSGAKWSSFNEFLLSFYTSEDPEVARQAGTCLGYRQNQSYAPERLLDIWLERTSGDSNRYLKQVIVKKAGELLIKESDRALHEPELRLPSTETTIPRLTSDFGLERLAAIYQTLLPCMWMLLVMLMTASNMYEQKHHREKIAVVIISMLLYARNRATNAFQVFMGVFLSSTGASRRVMGTLNHMGLSISYLTAQTCLETISKSAQERAKDFALLSTRLFAIVYDNINFTLRKASQRLDSLTEQLNATTSALFSLPSRFTRAIHAAALSIADRHQRAHLRENLTLDSLRPSPAKQAQLLQAFGYHVRMILLTQGNLGLSKKRVQKFKRRMKSQKPRIRTLSIEKTQFFPLPALAQEEASVGGTIQVVKKLFTQLLGLAEEIIDAELRLLVGDWLSIRNLRLMKAEIAEEDSVFLRMSWVQECAMPFHFQLNAMYMLFRTHLSHAGDNDPSSLEHHRTLLRRAKLDPKKPEYNKAKELLYHSLYARILDCARYVSGFLQDFRLRTYNPNATLISVTLQKSSHTDLANWAPKWDEFNTVASSIVKTFTSTDHAHEVLEKTDEVLAHAILFIRDALIFYEFSDAIRDADVGRMWLVYDFWVFMMRGAGCHNYGNEILEMKAQFEHEFPADLRDIIEHTWLVNRWGTPGRSIPTDLYLEHNNGFIKNIFAATGSNASMEYITKKASAGVEALRNIAHNVATYFGVSDFHRRHAEVSAMGDIKALLSDLELQRVHEFTSGRHVPPPPTRSRGKKRRKTPTTGVRDILLLGMQGLTRKRLFEYWQKRSGKGGTGLYEGDGEWNGEDDGREDDADIEEDEAPTGGTAFDKANGRLDVDVTEDGEFQCPFSDQNVGDDGGVDVEETLMYAPDADLL